MVRVVREEDGDRVFRWDTDAPAGDRVSVLVDGKWEKASATCGLFMRGTPVSEEELARLLKSGS